MTDIDAKPIDAKVKNQTPLSLAIKKEHIELLLMKGAGIILTMVAQSV